MAPVKLAAVTTVVSVVCPWPFAFARVAMAIALLRMDGLSCHVEKSAEGIALNGGVFGIQQRDVALWNCS